MLADKHASEVTSPRPQNKFRVPRFEFRVRRAGLEIFLIARANIASTTPRSTWNVQGPIASIGSIGEFLKFAADTLYFPNKKAAPIGAASLFENCRFTRG